MTQLTQLPITVAGASGRMGHMLIEAILASDDCRLAGALDIAASPALGQDAATSLGKASGVLVTSDLQAGLNSGTPIAAQTVFERLQDKYTTKSTTAE